MQGITRNFWPISRFISQMIQDRATGIEPQLLRNAYMKPNFRMVGYHFQ